MATRKTFEEFFSSKDSMYIDNGVQTPTYRRPMPPPPPRTIKENLTLIPDMDYESPIKIIQDKMRMQYDDDIYKVVQAYDISVDKDELIKALKYDRQQYEKGFRDGVKKFAEMLKTIEGLEENELFHNVVNSIAEELDGEHIG